MEQGRPPLKRALSEYVPEVHSNLVKQRVVWYVCIVFRVVERELDRWIAAESHKPLILRGARQVGKTWLVRNLAQRSTRHLVELNFERNPNIARAFQSNDPQRILGELSLSQNRDLAPESTLLFLDEIQAVPWMLAKLRWFAEDLPALPVIAAGSLLEFALADHEFSMPVGRVGFRHIEPMTFPEYLVAHGQDRLVSLLSQWRPGADISPIVHETAGSWFDRFSMVGGMPDVVLEDVKTGHARTCREKQRDLVATYRADFPRYAGRMSRGILDSVLFAIAHSLGQKFVYAHVDEGVKSHQAKQALSLLAAAKVCHVVKYSSGNGLPLAGESKDTFRKAILLDVGLLHALLDTPAAESFPNPHSIALQVRAAISEQLLGQQLRAGSGSLTGDGPQLHYWQREGGRPGEIDYLVTLASLIIPIELKSGAAGSMKSLHQFMFDKSLKVAVRIDGNPPSDAMLSLRTSKGDPVSYRLISLPNYLAWALPDIVGSVVG